MGISTKGLHTEGDVADAISITFDAEKRNGNKVVKAQYGEMGYTHQEFPKVVYHKDYNEAESAVEAEGFTKTVNSFDELKAIGPDYSEKPPIKKLQPKK